MCSLAAARVRHRERALGAAPGNARLSESASDFRRDSFIRVSSMVALHHRPEDSRALEHLEMIFSPPDPMEVHMRMKRVFSERPIGSGRAMKDSSSPTSACELLVRSDGCGPNASSFLTSRNRRHHKRFAPRTSASLS
jgi:hypothetical protein